MVGLAGGVASAGGGASSEGVAVAGGGFLGEVLSMIESSSAKSASLSSKGGVDFEERGVVMGAVSP